MIREEITETEYRVAVINSIAKQYKEARSESKAPTFRTYLSGYIPDFNE